MVRFARAFCLALGLTLAAASVARANARAPRTEPAMPSSAVQRPADRPNAVVLGEDLLFRCSGSICHVVARYLVECERAEKVRLDFILPVASPVTARVESTPTSPVVAPADRWSAEIDRRLRLRDRYILPDQATLPPLYQASASVDLVAGRNPITFEYDQPLAAIERGHGYFSNGRMLPEFFYLLWPLKEWSRGRAFALDLTVDVARPPASWWRRTFGHPVEVACDAIKGTQQQRGDRLVFTARLSDQFPDVLHCRIGESDLF
jgi:hypothetical protein